MNISSPVFVKTYKNNKRQIKVEKFNYSKLFWIFFIGCFLGVILETLYCIIVRRHYESRVGVIYGPFNPIYGFGAVLLTICLRWLGSKRDLYILLGSAVIGGAFEYFCSFCQEHALGTVSWEYSHTQYNFNGRTNVLYLFFWGLLGLIWVRKIYPRLSSLIERIPTHIKNPLTIILSVFMLINMLLSVMALERQSRRRKGILPTNRVELFLDKHYPDDLLKEIYANMMVVNEINSTESSKR